MICRTGIVFSGYYCIFTACFIFINQNIYNIYQGVMECNIQIASVIYCLCVVLFLSGEIRAEGESNIRINESDTVSFTDGIVHRIAIEGRPSYIFPTNSFLKGENFAGKPIRNAFSAHLKYSFKYRPDTYTDKIYNGVYQGVGLAYYSFGNKEELGNPVALYLFQGARIARFSSLLSLNYEWNFGVSAGWKPYDSNTNWNNKVIGSEINAYLNTNFYFNWQLSHQFDLTSGISLSHFSNGNTKFPNAGINTIGVKVGLVYNFNRKEYEHPKMSSRPFYPEYSRHISYDLVLFGSWRRKGVAFEDKQIPSPNAYPVLGFNFAPMYNLSYRIRVGASLDGVYDGSANVYTRDYIVGTEHEFLKPPLYKQLALGVSGRAEYVMPYFTVGIGLGTNVLHAGGDLEAFYQILALKIEVTRNSFIHIGYSIHDFHEPNFLMLGIGFRFNNKCPSFHR